MNEAAQCDAQSLWRGSIQLVYSNDSANEVAVLGGACFKTKAEMDANWAHIPEHVHTEGEPWCMADYCMPNGDITGDKAAMFTAEVKPGALFERDGKKREVVRFIPANRFAAPAVEWRRPGQVFRSSACSVSAWHKWVKEARQISQETP